MLKSAGYLPDRYVITAEAGHRVHILATNQLAKLLLLVLLKLSVGA